MRKVLLSHLIFIFCFTLFVTGCKKDNGGGGANCSTLWYADLQPEFDVITSAGTAYSLDPSAENCNALKSAYQDWINALKPYGDCATLTGQDRVEWQKAVDDAEAEVATLCD